jgi:hypothetical protein
MTSLALEDSISSQEIRKKLHWLLEMIESHPCSEHPLFAQLEKADIRDAEKAALLLKNYDAHASHLRRLLLKAATIMPEEAVGYILENVRNEYGNGRPEGRHQLQLQDVAWGLGIDRSFYEKAPVQAGIKKFIKAVTPFYFPIKEKKERLKGLKRPAIAAGAITATEVMAMKEFKYLQIAFRPFGLADHIWFDHVTVEQEHFDESITLAAYFADTEREAVEFGLLGVLDANLHLYDGLLATLT